MKKSKNDIWMLVISYIVLLVVIIVFASSCSPQRKMWKLEQKHPELLLQYCASKAITDTQIVYTPGHWNVDTTISTETPSVVNLNDSNTVLLPTKIVGAWLQYRQENDKESNNKNVDTGTKHSPVYIPPTKTIIINHVDTSGKALLRSENSRISDENNTLQGKLSTWQFWAILGWLLVVSLAVGIGFLIKWKRK